jgi:CheY-like chemotaxis protein
MRILVAEDTAESRELLIELLRHGGHTVAGVSNGREALEALEQNPYEVVFMDEEMPLANGLDTTRTIRRRKYGKRPIIIGMSGNTAESDERRCLDAGMDAFMSKPIRMPEVLAMLAVLSRRPAQAGSLSESSRLEAGSDLAAHLERATGGNKKLLRLLVRNFLTDAPKRLSALRRALARHDAEGLASAAHALKGSLGLFRAERAVSAARRLQVIGRGGHLEGADRPLRTLEEEFRGLEQKLAALEQMPGRARPAAKRRRVSRPGSKPRR